MFICFIFSINVWETFPLDCKSSIDKNGFLLRSSTIFLATVSPHPAIYENGGIISLSDFTFQIVASDSYKLTFKNLIPLAQASKVY